MLIHKTLQHIIEEGVVNHCIIERTLKGRDNVKTQYPKRKGDFKYVLILRKSSIKKIKVVNGYSLLYEFFVCIFFINLINY